MRTENEKNYILSLRRVSRIDTDLVGAKAANLGELAGAGFPVPEGFVLTTDAFNQFLKANAFDSGGTSVEVTKDDLPEEVVHVLLKAGAEIGNVPLAVRSSGVAEDLPGASFAGQYETVLGVRSTDELLQAVGKCWASAFSERVKTYQQTQGQPDVPRMAVLIQRLVEADTAGVAFTANPVTGDRTETVVSAIRGLGERLVSGQVTPDEWVVKEGQAISRQAPEGAIDAIQATDIAKLARRVEAHFGSPQDIEWAIAGGELYLLQARPVTTLLEEVIQPIPVPVEEPEGFWEREATHAPQPWTPMTSDVLYPLRNSSLRRAFDEFGILLETLEMKEIGGWEYARLVPLGGKDRPTPPNWLFWLLTHLVPQVRSRIRQSVKAMRAGKASRCVHHWYDEWQPEMETWITELVDVNLVSLTDAELDQHIEQTVTLFEQGNNIHFLLHVALGMILSEFVFTCRDLLGWDEDKAFEMLNGLSHKSTEPSRRLAALASLVQEHPTDRSILRNIRQDTLERLTQADPQFGNAFRAYMREYGCRALRYEIGDSTLAESPTFVLGLIQGQIIRGYDPATDDSVLEHKRKTTVEEARAVLADRSSQERERFERALSQAKEAYPVREDNEFYTFSAPVGLLRYALLETSHRLVARKQLRERDDVFFLQMDEARRALRDGSPQSALVGRRKGERTWILAHPGPASYGRSPGPPPEFSILPTETRMVMEATVWYTDRIFAQAQTRQADIVGGALRGIPASAGEYQGTVRIVMNESEFGKIKAGDVLVCPITSPVWSVLFPNIGALVTDTGGILSHPAIIAREYRVPAVVATGHATRELQDGQIVKVNGSNGTIEVVS